jgi:hypothetical protein
MVSYQLQFPPHCKHNVAITKTRDAHGGLYKQPNRLDMTLYGCLPLSEQRSFEISGTTHPTTLPHNPEFFVYLLKESYKTHKYTLHAKYTVS